MLYILSLDTGEEQPRTIVSSIVPYYEPEDLLNRNIVLVSNLKPANFRGVKSRGMLLAASDPSAEPHTTCEVLFADKFPVGTELLPEGTSLPEGPRSQVKADVFFSFPLHTRDGVVSVGGVPIGNGTERLVAHVYANGDVG
jgi:methionyl-tRNA synthetase